MVAVVSRSIATFTSLTSSSLQLASRGKVRRMVVDIMASKRKRSTAATPAQPSTVQPPPPPEGNRRSSRRIKEVAAEADETPVPAKKPRGGKPKQENDTPLGSKSAVEQAMKNLGEMEQNLQKVTKIQRLKVETSDLGVEDDSPARISRPPQVDKVSSKNGKKPSSATTSAAEKAAAAEKQGNDVRAAEATAEDIEGDEVDAPERGAKREPPVNSDILPLPWKGRLGYACLNTYLRTAKPPVFSSRTCRMGSIVDHRHPLEDPSQPEHATKNRPDKSKPADLARGQRYVEQLGLANARDIPKMIRWNHKYGIKFMRLSSEMFPFASHQEHGYKLEPFAAEVLAEAGKVAGELGHRLTTHPGQFTQIGSPRKEVVTAAVRDLEYHNELLSLLKLPEQLNRDAVMILHMGGTYGDKAATLDRFRENYKTLSEGVKRRMVLENDDVAWTVHDLLPICEELNIPMVLDYHHHNIMFNPSIREGTLDIIQFYDRIRQTWSRKGITQKMHYSESTAPATTPRDRRKHSPRVKTLPPCANDMDLMIEAKDKEQAVFELMRAFKLPGWHLFNDVVPHEREDESRKEVRKKAVKKSRKAKDKENVEGAQPEDDIETPEKIVSDEDLGMGGPQRRVYWPEGMEEWLKPKKREVKKNEPLPELARSKEEDSNED